MNLDQLHYFVTIVEQGTISKAAKFLHMSQPPISLQIKNLETELNTTLFKRGAREITLTPTGKALYNYANKIIELKNLAIEDINNLNTGKKGNLRIGIISSGSTIEFFDGLNKFKKHNPLINFKIYDGNTYELLDLLNKQAIELAIIRTPFPTTNLDIIKLKQDQIVVAGNDYYLSQLKDVVSLKELRDLPLIVYRRWEKILKEAFEKEGINPNIYCVNDDARTSIQWAINNQGLCLVPSSSVSFNKSIKYKHLENDLISSDLCLVKKTNTAISESANAFYNAFK